MNRLNAFAAAVVLLGCSGEHATAAGEPTTPTTTRTTTPDMDAASAATPATQPDAGAASAAVAASDAGASGGCDDRCALLARCHEGPFTGAECASACEAADDSPATLRTWSCFAEAHSCGAARICSGAVAPTRNRVDAQPLGTDVQAALEYRLVGTIGANDEASPYVLVLRVWSAQAERNIEIGHARQPGPAVVQAVDPTHGDAGTSSLFETDWFFAGAGDAYRIEHTGDVLQVRRRNHDEGNLRPHWEATTRVQLAHGAHVTAARLPD